MGDESPFSIIGHGRFKLKLNDGRIINLPRVLHIPNIERNFIYVRKMDVACLNTMCVDGGCKIILGSMVLMEGVWYVLMPKTG